MYPISTKFSDFLYKRDREWIVKAEIDGVEYDNTSIVDFEIENSLALGEDFEIGTVILSKLTVRLKTQDVIPPNAKIVPYLSLSLANMSWEDAIYPWQDADWPWTGGVTEWMPLGEFYVDSREKVNQAWVFTCYDKLVFADVPYVSALTYPTTMRAVWDEICTGLGYTYDSSVVIDPTYQIQVGPAGYSKRQVMGYIASANSASVYIGKDGKVKFKRFSVNDTTVFDMGVSEYFQATQTNPIRTLTKVVITYDTEDDLSYEAGTGDDIHTLYIENPFATQAIANDLLTTLNGFSYMPLVMDARGYPQLEAGDMIGFIRNESTTWMDSNTTWETTDISWDGLVRYQSIMLHTVFSFKGGLKMSIEAQSKSEQQSEFVVDGTLTTQINNLNKNAVKQGKNYFGVTITRDAGLIVEKTDHSSKVTFNSDELKWEVGGLEKLYYDAVDDVIKFGGTLEGADGVFSGELSAATGTFSGDLQAAGGTFTGTLSGVDGDFSGTITATAGTIGGWTIEASKLSGSGAIEGGTITGTTFRTAISGNRVEIVNGTVSVYDTGGLLSIKIDSTTNPPRINYYESGVLIASIERFGSDLAIAAENNASISGNSGVVVGSGSALTNILGVVKINNASAALNSITQSGTNGATLAQLEAQVNTIIQNLRAMKIYAT